MRTLKILTGLIMVIASLTISVWELTIRGSSSANLSVDPTEIDFGEIAEEQQLSSTVWLQNIGHDDVTILRTTGDCGCVTQTPLINALISPGEKQPLEIKWTVRDSDTGKRLVRLLIEYRIQSKDENLNLTTFYKSITLSGMVVDRLNHGG